MEIIIENHIPYIHGVLEQCGHTVSYLAPEQITPQSVSNADAIVIRTRTRADEALLDGSRVKHVVTATIGTDHIDTAYCQRAGIRVSNAPGCNAPAVAQYVLASIASIYGPQRLPELTLGIVGVGHVGKIVERWARALGMKVLRCDPPRAAREGDAGFVSLGEIAAEADVVTFHTPLDDTTRHLCGSEFISRLRRRPMIINAARGAVADTDALADALESGTVSAAAIDCWEGEPRISSRLLQLAAIATPHIAGYSAEGKMRASAMAAAAVDSAARLPLPAVSDAPTLDRIIATYDPMADTAALRAEPTAFEALRNSYRYRPEP